MYLQEIFRTVIGRLVGKSKNHIPLEKTAFAKTRINFHPDHCQCVAVVDGAVHGQELRQAGRQAGRPAGTHIQLQALRWTFIKR